MTILFVAILFALIISIEAFIHRGKLFPESVHNSVKPVDLEKVTGLHVSRELHFHPFHTWIRAIDSQTCFVGIDDLAKLIAGRPEKIILPLEGSVLQAGIPSVSIRNCKRVTQVVTPVSGEIVEVNKTLESNPELTFNDPYREGWLYKIKNWNLVDQKKSLLNGDFVVDWMKSSIQRIINSLDVPRQAFAQDGGLLFENFSEHLDRHEWSRLVKETLGTEAVVIV